MIATELRIGNYVEWNNTKLIVTCINIDFCIGYDKLKEESIHDQTSKPMFKPIPLTEDILLKCGFEYRISNDLIKSFEFNNLRVSHADGMESFIIRTSKEWAYLIDIKYLHQLQNLYFALTGEELTINL